MVGVVLLNARSIASVFPERFWIPGEEALAAIEPGMLVKVRALEAGPDDQADIWDSAPVWVVLEEVDDDIAHGTVTDSRFDRYRNASGTDVPATGSEILPPGHGRGCSLGCIRHHAVPSRDDQSSALVQLESIRTVATRAANAVGLYGPPGSKIPRSSAGFPCCRALGRTGRRVSPLRLLATSLAILLSANAFP